MLLKRSTAAALLASSIGIASSCDRGGSTAELSDRQVSNDSSNAATSGDPRDDSTNAPAFDALARARAVHGITGDGQDGLGLTSGAPRIHNVYLGLGSNILNLGRRAPNLDCARWDLTVSSPGLVNQPNIHLRFPFPRPLEAADSVTPLDANSVRIRAQTTAFDRDLAVFSAKSGQALKIIGNLTSCIGGRIYAINETMSVSPSGQLSIYPKRPAFLDLWRAWMIVIVDAGKVDPNPTTPPSPQPPAPQPPAPQPPAPQPPTPTPGPEDDCYLTGLCG